MSRVSRVQGVLRRWDPISVRPGEDAPADEYDGYAPRIVSMVVNGCSRKLLSAHLGVIRVDTIGVAPNPERDWEIAGDTLEALGE
ncbi:MAG: hypothetical protein HZA53_16315 [Planctomycetes bacterium]|nr:hypothetical protein [Planctomycetota bacterium]